MKTIAEQKVVGKKEKEKAKAEDKRRNITHPHCATLLRHLCTSQHLFLALALPWLLK